jgi:hypothetical protein
MQPSTSWLCLTRNRKSGIIPRGPGTGKPSLRRRARAGPAGYLRNYIY